MHCCPLVTLGAFLDVQIMALELIGIRLRYSYITLSSFSSTVRSWTTTSITDLKLSQLLVDKILPLMLTVI